MKPAKNAAFARRQIRPLFLAVSAASIAWQTSGRAFRRNRFLDFRRRHLDHHRYLRLEHGAVPNTGDTVDITNADAINRFIEYDALYMNSTPELSSLTINNTGGGQNILEINSSAVTLVSDTENVGDSNNPTLSGRGEIVQSNGDNRIVDQLFIGSYPDDNGLYLLQGGLLTVGGFESSTNASENVGNGGSATFSNSGGDDNISGDLLIANFGGNATYSLSSTGELDAANVRVGNGGTGTFIHSGGTAIISNSMYVGDTSSGSYVLSSGEITFDIIGNGEYVGYGATGTFNQTGGFNQLNLDPLYVGNNAGVSGTYSLSSTGTLSTTKNEYIGNSGNGTFIQSGGTNSVGGSMFFGA